MCVEKNWLIDVKKGVSLDSNLPEYKNLLSENFKCSALVDVVMEYFTLYEIWIENLNPYFDSAVDEINIIHEMVKRIANGESVSDMVKNIEDVRNIIIDKMKVVTAYVDSFLIYEYVLNRIEYKYTMSEEERSKEISSWNQDVYIGNLLKYIFGVDDNVVVNDRLREVLEQLPVRMARSKYLELIRNSIKLYKESDVDSLDGFIYVIRTSAMIYEPEEMKEYFTKFKKTLDELSEVDFTDIDEDYFRILQEKICKTSIELQDISDIYMLIQKIINMLYAYALNEKAEVNNFSDKQNVCTNVLKELSEAFEKGNSDEMDVSILLGGLEGLMEKLYDNKILLESVLDDIVLSHAKSIDDCGLTEEFDVLKLSQKFFSTSLFVELEDIETKPVTNEYIEEVSEKLTADLLDVISRSKRPVIRAIMASTISKLPTFFSTSEEVMDYIQYVFSQCSDNVELIASIRLLDELTEQ